MAFPFVSALSIACLVCMIALSGAVTLRTGPLRAYWPENLGYCGEFSVQVAAAYNGHWVSQRVARALAGGEVLIADWEGENIKVLLHKLGLKTNYWRKQPFDAPGLERYMAWIKQQVEAGMIVVFPARLAQGKDRDYDHLMPLYGVNSASGLPYSPEDEFIWTTGLRTEVSRSPKDPSFFADSTAICKYSMEDGGCISSSSPTYGAAVAGLPDRYGIYLPLRLEISAWEDDETRPVSEPRNGTVEGHYDLDLSDSRLVTGDAFTIFRFGMVAGNRTSTIIPSGRVLANQPSLEALQAICDAAGPECNTHRGQVGSEAPTWLEDAHKLLGKLPAESVTFFIAVKGPSNVTQSG